MPSAENVTDPSVSPDGKAIAFQSGVRDFNLMELPLDGLPPRPLLVTSQWEDSPDWSPVAPEYVYVSQDAIWVRRRSTRDSGTRLVVDRSAFSAGEEAFRFASPSFSPDGARVAYTTGVYRNDIRGGWISATNGGAPAPLGQFGGNVSGLTWSPDELWIALNWAPSPASGSRLAKIRVGSAEPVVLDPEGCAFSPAWSPDSSRLLCSAGGVLYTISAEGGERQFLGQEYEAIAAWSREMRYIYVIRNANNKRQLGKLDLKSGIFRPLTDVPVEWTINTPSLGGARLSLSPDGKSLAVTVVKTIGDIWILEGFQSSLSLWQRLPRR
jgi:dipeptidyl aminopeptidase/acylaminoacyl peptidase